MPAHPFVDWKTTHLLEVHVSFHLWLGNPLRAGPRHYSAPHKVHLSPWGLPRPTAGRSGGCAVVVHCWPWLDLTTACRQPTLQLDQPPSNFELLQATLGPLFCILCFSSWSTLPASCPQPASLSWRDTTEELVLISLGLPGLVFRPPVSWQGVQRWFVPCLFPPQAPWRQGFSFSSLIYPKFLEECLIIVGAQESVPLNCWTEGYTEGGLA